MSLIVSVIVPVYNEEGAAVPLAREIDSVFGAAFGAGAYEIIFVDDKSTDNTLVTLIAAKTELSHLRVLTHAKNAGQSRAVRTGIIHAKGVVIVTLDGDGQNPPQDAPRLAQRLLASGPEVGMVAGRRIGRKDSRAKTWASKLANGFRKRLLNDGADDTGCGLKAIRRDVFLRLPYFDHIHRYLPALVNREGYVTLFEDVSHRRRTTGASKYTNLGRLVVAVSDLLGVMWLNRRARLPGEVTEI
jgi:dolichol-phosphate mannosyltransferase